METSLYLNSSKIKHAKLFIYYLFIYILNKIKTVYELTQGHCRGESIHNE